MKTVHKPISDNHCLRCYKAKYAIDPNDRHLRVYASLLMGINIHVLLLVLRLILPILLFFSTFFFQLLLTSCFSSTHNMPYPISFNYNIFSGVAIFFYYSFLCGLFSMVCREKSRTQADICFSDIVLPLSLRVFT